MRLSKTLLVCLLRFLFLCLSVCLPVGLYVCCLLILQKVFQVSTACLLLCLCVCLYIYWQRGTAAAETVHATVTGRSSAPCLLLTYPEEGGAPTGCAGCCYRHLHQILPGYRQRPPPKASQGEELGQESCLCFQVCLCTQGLCCMACCTARLSTWYD